MRVIKFRGITSKGAVLCGDLLRDSDNDFYILQLGDTFETEVVKESVGQFTGLFDKNGKEIYEGDIFHAFGMNLLIEWHYGALGFFAYRGEKHADFHPLVKHNYLTIENGALKDIEVIGNIYEHPELLPS